MNGIITNTSANTELRVPYLGFSPSGLLAEETRADSRYNSFQARVAHRFHAGLRFQFSYTFSKSMDDSSGGQTSIFAEVTGDESNISGSKGISDFDRTHRAVLHFGYEIPAFGLAKTGLGSAFLRAGKFQESPLGNRARRFPSPAAVARSFTEQQAAGRITPPELLAKRHREPGLLRAV